MCQANFQLLQIFIPFKLTMEFNSEKNCKKLFKWVFTRATQCSRWTLPLDNWHSHEKGQEWILPFVTTYHSAVQNLKQKILINVTLEPDTLSAFSKNNLCKTSDHLSQKEINSLKTLWEQKYNFKAIMHHNH